MHSSLNFNSWHLLVFLKCQVDKDNICWISGIFRQALGHVGLIIPQLSTIRRRMKYCKVMLFALLLSGNDVSYDSDF